jgi:hypothetical protein
MQPARTYCTDAELADLKPDTEAKLHINPPGPADHGITLGPLVKRAMDVLTTPDRPQSVEIELTRQKSWLSSDQIRQLAKNDRFQGGG